MWRGGTLAGIRVEKFLVPICHCGMCRYRGMMDLTKQMRLVGEANHFATGSVLAHLLMTNDLPSPAFSESACELSLEVIVLL